MTSTDFVRRLAIVDHDDRQQAFGLYGGLIIEPRGGAKVTADLDYTVQLQEWLKREWLTYPAMLMEGALTPSTWGPASDTTSCGRPAARASGSCTVTSRTTRRTTT